jgi:putative transcriptional regulator
VGKRIVELRKAKGMSQADLAKACFKDPQSIERIENAKVNTTVFTLYQIAQALDVPPKELLNF